MRLCAVVVLAREVPPEPFDGARVVEAKREHLLGVVPGDVHPTWTRGVLTAHVTPVAILEGGKDLLGAVPDAERPGWTGQRDHHFVAVLVDAGVRMLAELGEHQLVGEGRVVADDAAAGVVACVDQNPLAASRDHGVVEVGLTRTRRPSSGHPLAPHDAPVTEIEREEEGVVPPSTHQRDHAVVRGDTPLTRTERDLVVVGREVHQQLTLVGDRVDQVSGVVRDREDSGAVLGTVQPSVVSLQTSKVHRSDPLERRCIDKRRDGTREQDERVVRVEGGHVAVVVADLRIDRGISVVAGRDPSPLGRAWRR